MIILLRHDEPPHLFQNHAYNGLHAFLKTSIPVSDVSDRYCAGFEVDAWIYYDSVAKAIREHAPHFNKALYHDSDLRS